MVWLKTSEEVEALSLVSGAEESGVLHLAVPALRSSRIFGGHESEGLGALFLVAADALEEGNVEETHCLVSTEDCGELVGICVDHCRERGKVSQRYGTKKFGSPTATHP